MTTKTRSRSHRRSRPARSDVDRREAREAKLAEARKILDEGLDALLSDETYRSMLKQMASFHSYSPGNYLLIFAQSLVRGTSPQLPVAGYNDWRNKHNRHVVKGETGYWIWAPTFKWITDADDERRKVLTGFYPVKAFTFDQTEGEPLATIAQWQPTGDGPAGAWEALVRVAEADGWTISREPSRRGEQGYTAFEEKRINITPGQSGALDVQTLAHELAHTRLHAELGGTYARHDVRSRAEIEAESTAFVVLHALGVELDDSRYSLAYVLDWAKGNHKAISETVQAVHKAAHGLLADAERLSTDPFRDLDRDEVGLY